MGASEFHKDNETGNGSHLPEVAAFVKFFAAEDYAMELEV